MGKQALIYEKIMTGYEFIEFMRSFNWKGKDGKYLTGYHKPMIVEARINKKNFQGWEYWFDRRYPEDVLLERRVITYPYCPQRDTYARKVHIFLVNKGFILSKGDYYERNIR